MTPVEPITPEEEVVPEPEPTEPEGDEDEFGEGGNEGEAPENMWAPPIPEVLFPTGARVYLPGPLVIKGNVRLVVRNCEFTS